MGILDRFGRALDSTLAVVAPKRAAERAFWRDHFRSYDAATKGARGRGWVADRASAKASIGRFGDSLEELRARSRDLVANNPWATKAVSSIVSNVIGAGIEPRLKSNSRNDKKAARDDWEAFSERCDPRGKLDFNGVQALAMRTVVESGEALIRWHERPFDSGLPIPLQCEVLEPDWIDSRITRREKDENGLDGITIHGVALDALGSVRGYYLFDQHPGDDLLLSRQDKTSKFVPARYVDHMFRVDRAEQVRGLPWMVPSALRLHELRTYEEFELNRKIFGSMFVAFVRSPIGPSGPRPLTGEAERVSGRQTERARPGMVKYLNPGEDVTLPTPPNADGYDEYTVSQLRAVAAGIGCTYEQLTGDFSKVTYLSSRGALQEYRQLLDGWQWHLAIPQTCQPAWRRVQGQRRALGRPGIGPALWQPPARPWIDPVKDGEAEKNLLRLGLKTIPQALAERGLDAAEQFDEIAAAQNATDELGLKFDGDARQQQPGFLISQQVGDKNAN